MEAFALHGALRRGDLALVRRARGRLPGRSTRARSRRCSTSLRREPAPARGLLRRDRRAHAPDVDGVEAARQGAVVQQPARPRRRAARWSTSSSCRPRRSSSTTTRAARRSAATIERGVRQGAGHRSAERVRRRLLLQPAGRPRAGREAERDVRGGGLRAGLRRGRARGARAEAERAAAREPGAAHASPVTEHDIKRVRGGILVQDRDTGLEEREEMQRRHRAQADRGGVGRAAVRDAGVQARALERDRAVDAAWARPGSAPGR